MLFILCAIYSRTLARVATVICWLYPTLNKFYLILSYLILSMSQVLWCNIVSLGHNQLTHWGWVTHICVGKLTIIGSDNGLSPGRRQAIIWNNAGLFLIEPLGSNFSEISNGIQTFSFKKMHLNMSSAKWRLFCLGLNVLRLQGTVSSLGKMAEIPTCGMSMQCDFLRMGILVSPCLSVDRIVSALYLQEYSSDPFHICTSYQATSEGVSRVMPVSKFKNL